MKWFVSGAGGAIIWLIGSVVGLPLFVILPLAFAWGVGVGIAYGR